MWRKLAQTFVHPVGIFGYALMLAHIADLWELFAAIVGLELIVLRHHHHSYPEHHDSVFDADWVAVLGIFVFFAGECRAIAYHSPAVGLLLVFIAGSVQLVSFGWHEHQHHPDRAIDAFLKIMAGALVSLALTIATISLPLTLAVVAFCLD